MSTGTPYIGSKISLISKAEIRYEGFLYTIDQKDSTVTLAKVVSLGTEDRCPQKPVPAREEVFEYIVFRGSDIKDLHVCEGPKSNTVDDPAIVHNGPVQQPSQNYGQNSHFPQGYGPMSGMPPMGYHLYGFQQNGAAFDIQRQKTPPNLPRTPTPDPPKVQTHEERPQVQKTSSQHPRRENNNRDRGNSNKTREQNDRRDNRGAQDRRDKLESRPKDRVEYKEQQRDYKHSDNDIDHHSDSTKTSQTERKQADNSSDRRRGAQRGVHRGIRGNRGSRSSTNNRTKFTADFDFEGANSKFNKEEIEKELLKVLHKIKIKDDVQSGKADTTLEKDQDDLEPLPSPDKYYDRSKSFFDNISCEAMGAKGEDEKMTRRKELALNLETFGGVANRFRGGYNARGRSRGYAKPRGRGSYRGRGNYNSNYNTGNRNWVDYEFDYEAAGLKKNAKAGGN